MEYERAPDSPIVKSGVRIAPLARVDECHEEPEEKEVHIVRGEHRKSSYDRVIKEYIESFSQRREAQRQQEAQVEDSYN